MLKEHVDTIKKELEVLKIWFDVNKLSLNANKTKCMVFGKKKYNNNDINGKISDAEIEWVWETTFWGVVIDYELCQKQHVDYLTGGMSKSIASLHKTKNILNFKGLY